MTWSPRALLSLLLPCVVSVSITLASRSARAEAQDGEEVVDRILVVIGALGAQGEELRIVTAFELEIEVRLVLAERSRSLSSANIRFDERFANYILDNIIGQYLLVDEATRLQLVSPETRDLASARAELEENLGGPGMLAEFCETFGAPDDLINQIISRRIVAEEFVRQNIQLAFSVTENELIETFESGDHPFGNSTFEDIRGALEALILTQRRRDRLSQWLQNARDRSRIRRIDP